MIVTGNRLADGRILTALSFFDLAEGEHKTIDIKIRKDAEVNDKLGNIDLKQITSLFDLSNAAQSGINKKGLVVLWAEPDKEPTKHVFNDLIHLKQELDEWGGYILVLTNPDVKWSGFSPLELKSMPSNILSGHDNRILPGVFNSSETCEIRLPYVVMADKNGKILYSSSGYSIGIGEQILRFTK